MHLREIFLPDSRFETNALGGRDIRHRDTSLSDTPMFNAEERDQLYALYKILYQGDAPARRTTVDALRKLLAGKPCTRPEYAVLYRGVHEILDDGYHPRHIYDRWTTELGVAKGFSSHGIILILEHVTPPLAVLDMDYIYDTYISGQVEPITYHTTEGEILLESKLLPSSQIRVLDTR